MKIKQTGVMGRASACADNRRWIGPATALAMIVAGCVEPGGPDEAGDDESAVALRSSEKGFEAEFAKATEDTLFIELYESKHGNVRIIAKVAKAEQDAKDKSFIVRGPEDSPFVLRDDGKEGDDKAGDQIFSALADVDIKQLQDRTTSDKEAIEKDKVDTVPVFRGRVEIGEVEAVPFDLDGFLGGKLVPFNPSFLFPWWNLSNIRNRSLMVTDVGVVNDPTRTSDPCTPGPHTPGGDWTFARLMTEMAGPNPPSDFVEDWLDHWLTNQTVNGFVAAARPNIQSLIIDPWRAASGGGALDLELAPFRLLAIVNRVDLRGGGSAYGGGDAGEMRFVFGLLDDQCVPQPMTVILEYGVPRSGCFAVRDWAQKWWALQTKVPGTPAYNNALAALVEEVVVAGAAPSKPNGSAINQVRTNEIAIAAPWELREFRLGQPSDPSNLVQTTVALTPHDGFKPVHLNDDPGMPALDTNPATVSGTVAIDNYVSSHLGSLCPPVSVLPTHDFTGSAAALLGASSQSPGDPDQPPPFGFVFWKLLNLSNSALTCERHTLSINTCNACHSGETQTRNFLHVNSTVPLGSPATLSGFLTGINVPDPAVGAPTRRFNDLLRRARDLHGLVHSSCFRFPRLEVDVAVALQKAESLPGEDQMFTKGKFTDVVVEDLRHERPPVH